MTEHDNISDRQRFEELQAFYVNGSLDGADRQWLADYLVRHPEAATLLATEEKLRAVVRATASPVSEAERLKRLLAEFRALAPHRSWLKRLAEWFANTHRIPAPAIAAATMLLLVQGIALVQLLPDRQAESEIYRGASVPCEDSPRIRVVFKPDAQQAEVVLLLRKVEATVVAGPTETGQLWIRIPKGRPLDEALGQLRASALVDEAILIEPDGKGCTR